MTMLIFPVKLHMAPDLYTGIQAASGDLCKPFRFTSLTEFCSNNDLKGCSVSVWSTLGFLCG